MSNTVALEKTGQGPKRTSLSVVLAVMVGVFVAVLVGASVFIFGELRQIRDFASETVERVLPQAQERHQQAVDVAGLFNAFNTIQRTHNNAERSAALSELVMRASSLRKRLPSDEGQLLEGVTTLSHEIAQLHNEQHHLDELIEQAMLSEFDIFKRVRRLLLDVRTEVDTGISDKMMHSADLPVPQMAHLHREIGQLAGTAEATSGLVEVMEQMHVQLLGLNLKTGHAHGGVHGGHFFELAEALPGYLEKLEASGVSGSRLRTLTSLLDDFTALDSVFEFYAKRERLDEQIADTSHEVESRLTAMANRLNASAGSLSSGSARNISEVTQLTLVVGSVVVVALILSAWLIFLLLNREVVKPLTQAAYALDSLRQGDQDISLTPSRFKEIAAIHWSINRLITSTNEVAEVNGRLEHEIELRRSSEGQALRMREQMGDAIESIADGFLLFDADEKMVLCNSNFRRFFRPLNDVMEAGSTTFTQFLELASSRGVFAERSLQNEGSVDNQLNAFRKLATLDELQLQDGRWLSVHNYLTKDGGTVCVYTDITERKHALSSLQRKTELVQMLREIAIYSNDAVNIEDAMQVCIERICAFSGFVVGHVFVPAADHRDVLVSMTTWYLKNPDQFDAFRLVSEQVSFKKGEGLPGRVWQSKKLAWIDDVSMDPNFPRYDIAGRLGLSTGFAFPVMEHGEVVAVLEFFADRRVEKDEAMIDAVAGLSSPLGRVIERKRAEQELAKLHRAVEQSPASIIITNASGEIEYVNPRFVHINGYSLEEVRGQRPSVIKSGRTPDSTYNDLWETIKNGNNWRGELENKTKDGVIYWASVTISPIRNESGEITHFIGITEDVTERKRAAIHIEHLAHYDSLTDLPNRAMFGEYANHILANAQREQQAIALLMLDLDDFKDVNDGMGHAAGDKLLQAVAARLNMCMRESDLVSRLGGDEFAVLLHQADNIDDVAVAAKRIIDAISQPFEVEGNNLYISVSIGIAMYPNDAEDIDQLLQYADLAMYRSKNAAPGSYKFFMTDMDREVRRRKQMEAELRLALDNEEFYLVFQPQVNTHDRRIVGVEALLRWRHPERGFVSPGEFIPVAEHSNLIIPIGTWVLREACRQAVEWREQGYDKLVVSVNVSPAQFKHHDLLQTVSDALFNTGLEPSRLCLEITEGVVMQDAEENLEILRKLREQGVTIALDDFGTGYSSLSYLTHFPIDKLKIDRSFIKEIDKDSTHESVIHTVADLGRRLGMIVVAEGVENLAQYQIMCSHPIDEIQGFYFSKPEAPEVIVQMMGEFEGYTEKSA